MATAAAARARGAAREGPTGGAELEARWNGALERVREREGRLAAFDARTIPKQQINEHALSRLAQDLPALWHEPTTDMRLKQRIVRILIHGNRRRPRRRCRCTQQLEMLREARRIAGITARRRPTAARTK